MSDEGGHRPESAQARDAEGVATGTGAPAGVIRLALPVYVELLTAVVAVGLIDLFWVSGLGRQAVAAVTIATTTEHLALGVVLALGTGTTVLVGRRDGREPIRPAIRTAWLLWAAASLAVAVPGVLFREPLAGLFTGDAATAGLTADFYLVSLAGIPVFYAQTLADGIFKGLGDTTTPMRAALLCNALVVALDPLFVYGLDLGVRGAALATVLARAVAFAVSLVLLLRRLPRDSRAGASRTDAAEIVRIGLPMSGDFLARAIVSMIMVEVVGGFGVAALAGYGIGTKIMLAGVMAFYALRQATMIQTARSGEAGPALRYGLLAGLAVAAGLVLSAPFVTGLFTGDPTVVAAAADFLRWMPLYLVPFGGLIAVGGVLQANGKGGRLLAATLAGFAVQLPLTYALGSLAGVTGVWLAMAAGSALALALATLPIPSWRLRAWRARRGSGPQNAPGRAPRSTRTAAGRRSAR
ncbi:MATE family efflux transporter [Streptosporangium carneum]|uniref:Probable multidrug resistance protein NorM n=1 Tax=Streptosporangium carneum TaxID=47481 RepID=A0A9W6I8E5_9ACTN|nr:MATE family efflux transporter [Streptosporangium carneum]GLK13657.1 MATE family efflux transporter [Streptosporangium carneum]